MKKTFWIESIKHFEDTSYSYTSIPQNAKWLYDVWEFHNLECTNINQSSNAMWKVTLKGRKKNIQNFIRDFSIVASKIYTLQESRY